MRKNQIAKYKMIAVNLGEPKICLPIDMDGSALINISTIGGNDGWARFMDRATGNIYNCKDLYDKAILEELK